MKSREHSQKSGPSRKGKFGLIDLFAGAGGLTLGFVDDHYCGDFQCQLGIDNDPSAVATHEVNFSGKAVCADVETYLRQGENIPKSDVVIGGPPCQGFSLLNKKREGDARRALWEPFLEVVTRAEASVFVMENVPGLIKSTEFINIVKRARSLGFVMLQPAVLNTADYGVAQTRKRAIAVGVKSDDFAMGAMPSFPPDPTHAAPDLETGLPPWRTVRELISGLPRPKGTEVRHEDPYPLNLHFGRKPTAVSKERYRAVPPGGNRFDLQRNRPDITPECWIKKTSGGTDLFGRLWWDRPSVTIRTEFFKPEKGRYLHPSAHRPITHREAARLMSFPDDFQFSGSKIDIAKQIGNAVPPEFAGHIAKFVSVLLSNRKVTKGKKAA